MLCRVHTAGKCIPVKFIGAQNVHHHQNRLSNCTTSTSRSWNLPAPGKGFSDTTFRRSQLIRVRTEGNSKINVRPELSPQLRTNYFYSLPRAAFSHIGNVVLVPLRRRSRPLTSRTCKSAGFRHSTTADSDKESQVLYSSRAEISAAMQKSHLKSRPGAPNQFVEPSPATLGVHTLGLDNKRDGLMYVPPSYTPDKPSPLMICLHGAGSNGRNGLSLLEGFPTVDESATILVAPDSRGRTWDFILGDYGPDVLFIDRALDHVFKRYNVHPGHIGIAGFSDGASYALSLGIANGLFFSHVLAFSPGFMRPPVHEDTPKIYMTHGTNDQVLPIERCARRLYQEIRRLKYPMVYREFTGGHSVPTDLAQEGLDYFLGKKQMKREE